MQFNLAQTFYLDPDAVSGTSEIFLTSIELFFKTKPAITNNASGIYAPGVFISLCQVENDVPDTTKIIQASFTRVGYDAIAAMTDASVGTKFSFTAPLPVKTGKFYAVLVKFEDPAYALWSSKQGDKLVGTNTPSAGQSGIFDGKYYDYGNDGNWQALNDRDLKYRVNIAKFSSNNITIEMTNKDYEFITYSNRSGVFVGGEYVYPEIGFGNTNSWLTGTCNIQTGNTTVSGTSTTFTTQLAANVLVLFSDGTRANTNILRVSSVTSANSLILRDAPSFTNSAAYWKILPVGKVYYTDYVKNFLVLDESNANSTVRFLQSPVANISIVAGGSGYSNSDTIKVSNATLNAAANLVTNSSGGIIQVKITNTGYGFTTPVLAITTSGGTGANLVPAIGTTLRGLVSNASANLVTLDDYDVHSFIPEVLVNIPSDAYFNTNANFAYVTSNTYYVNNSLEEIVSLNQINEVSSYSGLVMSRSEEVINTTNLHQQNKSSVIKINFGINRSNTNLYTSPFLFEERADVFILKNSINNDDTDENTRFGNALSKHITTKLIFANNRFAEDIRVISTVYRPSNTNIKMFAKIHNSNDSEAFDDKDWSELEIKDGGSVYSSTDNSQDMIEISWGFPQYPSSSVLSGTITTTDDSAEIVGLDTAFNTDLAADDVIRIQSALFPNNHMIAVVNAVTNATHLTIRGLVTNNNVVDSGMNIYKITRPMGAFNNILNDNIVRYYNSERNEFDTYDSAMVKIVLLADAPNKTPRVDDIRIIGVSA